MAARPPAGAGAMWPAEICRVKARARPPARAACKSVLRFCRPVLRPPLRGAEAALGRTQACETACAVSQAGGGSRPRQQRCGWPAEMFVLKNFSSPYYKAPFFAMRRKRFERQDRLVSAFPETSFPAGLCQFV
ncbi:MAG: hypothetical protein Pg6A_11330 [Termitinemataceae bacterium]|nr:MAG: hypothetical protein Pg6A_11330 [Termitinemataceae bacterium]